MYAPVERLSGDSVASQIGKVAERNMVTDARIMTPEFQDADRSPVSTDHAQSMSGYPEPNFDGQKWPAWAVTLFVVGFCGAFWFGLTFVLLRLFA